MFIVEKRSNAWSGEVCNFAKACLFITSFGVVSRLAAKLEELRLGFILESWEFFAV